MFDFRASRRRSRLHRGFQLNGKHILSLSTFIRLIFFGLIAAVIAVPILFLWYSRDLPTPGTLVEPKFKDATRIYDREGKLLYSVYQEQNRTYVKLDKMPDNLLNATIAIEDKDFYKNQGFSIAGYLRTIPNLLRFGRLTGGSTITQQLVKNVLLTSERRLSRKIKELILAIQVDKRFTKDQILEMYLNNISYGSTAIGVEAASQTYFGKKVQDLDIAESAFLAGLPQSPTTYSPFAGDKYYIARTDAVLKQMVSNKYISKEQKEKALEKISEYKFSQRETAIKAPHFVLYVRKLLADQFGEQYVYTGGLQVTTTLDYELQEKAEEIVKEELERIKKYRVGNGSALITNPKTGEVLAMVGSKDYFDEKNKGNFNAVFAQRQPGSSLKPIIYARAFEKGYTSSTMLMDVKTDFPTDEPAHPIYTPVNYSGKFTGPIQLRFALGNSINLPAVKLVALVGVKDAMQKGYDMGITNWDPTPEHLKDVGLSLVLGGRETTLYDEVTAYGVFANKGIRQDLVTIQKVTDSKGKKLYEYKKKEGKRVLSEEISFLISHILLDNIARIQEFGANSYLRIPGKTVAVKTGTTDQKRDNWTVGYTPSAVVGVWVGNNDNTPMNPIIASGVTGASPIWHQLMVLALKGKSDEQFEKPQDVLSLEIDAFGGGLPVDGQSRRSEYFVKGTEPTTKSQIYQKDFYVVKENDPISVDGVNRWQQGIDTWISQNRGGDAKWNPPDDVKNPNPQEQQDDPTPTPGSQPDDPTETPVPTETPTSSPTPSP